MSRVYYTFDNMKTDLSVIVRDMANDQWRPDVIVGVARGGHIPAVMLSHYYDVNYKSVKVQFREKDNSVAITSITAEMNDFPAAFSTNNRNVLVVDDINDSGKTFEYIENAVGTQRQDDAMPVVKYAALVDNIGSSFSTDYSAKEINKEQDPSWIVFPWEEWWG